MRAVIAGGSGFVGLPLCRKLQEIGYELIILSNNLSEVANLFGKGNMGFLLNEDTRAWENLLEEDTILINLMGEDLYCKNKTSSQQKNALDEMLIVGKIFEKAISHRGVKPRMLLQNSSTSYYGEADGYVKENATSGDSSLSEFCVAWEKSTDAIEKMGIPRVIVRSGLVLGAGGFLERLVSSYRKSLCFYPRKEKGEREFSWVHENDLAAAVVFLLEQKDISGVFNINATAGLTCKNFAKKMSSIMRRPTCPLPDFLMQAYFGKHLKEVISSLSVCDSGKIQNLGFSFAHSDIDIVLHELVETILEEKNI